MSFLRRLFGRSTAEGPAILVLLRSSPFAAEQEEMEAIARQAWAERFGLNTDGSDFVDSGAPGKFVLSPHGNAVLVLGSPRGARQLKEPKSLGKRACAEAWRVHVADLSVQIAYACDTDLERLNRYVGTLTAELADRDSLALLHLQNNRLLPINQDVIEDLRDGSDRIFGE